MRLSKQYIYYRCVGGWKEKGLLFIRISKSGAMQEVWKPPRPNIWGTSFTAQEADCYIKRKMWRPVAWVRAMQILNSPRWRTQ